MGRSDFSGLAVEIHAEGEHAQPIVGAKLRGKRGEKTGEDVAGTTFRKTWISAGVYKKRAIGRSNNGVEAFQD